MKNNKKNIALLAVSVLALVLVVGGAAYAYFQARMDSGSSANINATTATTDSLKFEDGKPLSITADLDNFAEGAGNETDSTMVSAKLIANNTTNSATFHYNVYLDILTNDLQYTSEAQTAELIMQVIDPKDNVVASIPGLNYVTVGGVSGFDITEEQDLITIASNYEIKAEAAVPTAQKTDEWEVTLVLVNLDTDQSENMGKQFSAKVLIQQEEKKATTRLAKQIISTYGKDATLLHHDASLTNGANDGSYRYSGANPNNYVCFGSNEYTCSEDNLYRIIGVFNNQVKLIKYDYVSADDLGLDSVRDADASKFEGYKGSKESIAAYNWGTEWTTSPLQGALNTGYLTNIGSAWANKIATSTWYIGGLDGTTITTTNAKNVFDYEVGNSKKNETFEAKIGLMYVSDYYYAASPTYWTYSGWNNSDETTDYRAAANDNWLYMGMHDYTISRSSSPGLAYVPSTPITRLSNSLAAGCSVFNTQYSISIRYAGNVQATWYDCPENGPKMGYSAARPTFNLSSNVAYASGTGSKTDPYRLYFEDITFKIGDTEYTAKEGMTWKEWVSSDYDKSFNTTEWKVSASTVYANGEDGANHTLKDPETNSNESPNAVIKNGHEYSFTTTFAYEV